MIFQVEQKHIDLGKRHHTFCNPIALGLAETNRFAVVTEYRAHLITGILDLPPNARAWLFDFNLGRRVYPTSFEL